MAWIDNAIITVIVVGGAAIMYKGLKEPIDLVGSWIKKGAIGVIGMFKGAAESTGVQEITYG